MNLDDVRIGFLGTGKMATALASGFVRELVTPDQIIGSDPSDESRSAFTSTIGTDAIVAGSPEECLAAAQIIFLAVKPQVMDVALGDLQDALDSSQLIVSIAAGTSIQTLETLLPAKQRVIRVMPNTPCLIGKGASGISPGTHATEDDISTICRLLQTVGIVESVPERLLDAVTGLSGSGPAYVFQMIEALSDGGVRAGLPRQTATRLAAQTLTGAAELLLQTGEHPGVLKDAVTSPGGTTIAGLQVLEQAGLRAALIDAVEAATNRSIELGAS